MARRSAAEKDRRPYTYPKCAALFEQLANEHGEFGYWEIDLAIAKTIDEMKRRGMLVVVEDRRTFRFKLANKQQRSN